MKDANFLVVVVIALLTGCVTPKYNSDVSANVESLNTIERVVQLVDPLPATAGMPSLLEQEMDKHRVRCTPIPDAPGNVFYMLNHDAYFIQWDIVVSENEHFYGPFPGDPHDELAMSPYKP